MTSVYIGVDAGGTKTALRRLGPDETGARAAAGPGVNLQRDGLGQSATVLADLLRPLLNLRDGEHSGGEEVRAVCIGVSGAGREEEQAALGDAIRQRLERPDLPLLVTHDAVLALEAVFGAGSGAVCIAGTGSVVYGRTQSGEVLRTGGWGALLGDEGSGTAIGQQAARAVARAFDGGPPTALTGLFAQHHGIHSAADLIRQTYREHRPFAALAPLVLHAAATDPIADAVLRQQADLLLQDVRRLASRAGDALAPRLAFLGGLAGEPAYRAYLDTARRRHLPRWQQVEATAEPVDGALRLAQRWADEQEI